jgi:hypothetical protein
MLFLTNLTRAGPTLHLFLPPGFKIKFLSNSGSVPDTS